MSIFCTIIKSSPHNNEDPTLIVRGAFFPSFSHTFPQNAKPVANPKNTQPTIALVYNPGVKPELVVLAHEYVHLQFSLAKSPSSFSWNGETFARFEQNRVQRYYWEAIKPSKSAAARQLLAKAKVEKTEETFTAAETAYRSRVPQRDRCHQARKHKSVAPAQQPAQRE